MSIALHLSSDFKVFESFFRNYSSYFIRGQAFYYSFSLECWPTAINSRLSLVNFTAVNQSIERFFFFVTRLGTITELGAATIKRPQRKENTKTTWRRVGWRRERRREMSSGMTFEWDAVWVRTRTERTKSCKTGRSSEGLKLLMSFLPITNGKKKNPILLSSPVPTASMSVFDGMEFIVTVVATRITTIFMGLTTTRKRVPLFSPVFIRTSAFSKSAFSKRRPSRYRLPSLCSTRSSPVGEKEK